MNLSLDTIDIWTFGDEFAPEMFLRQLRVVLQPDDVIAFGTYSPSERFRSSSIALQAMSIDANFIYTVTFDFNRLEHPNGRSFELPASAAILDALIMESKRPDGQDDKPLFFDHFVGYRRGVPAVPLLCFLDAFYGGTLALSGHYLPATVENFARGLPSSYARQPNPENYPGAGQAVPTTPDGVCREPSAAASHTRPKSPLRRPAW